MNNQIEQTREYEWMLEATLVPLAKRLQIMRGAELFFRRGWPNNHFTVGMAQRAGMGLVPPIYEGVGTEGRYFLSMKDEPLEECA